MAASQGRDWGSKVTVNLWSTTAASNATADDSINWREGQAASTVNNSARAMMAAIAKWRDDQSGNLETGGSSTAYTITSSQSLTPIADGYSVAARMHTTNGVSPTLNVDSTGAKAIRVYTSTAIPTGALNGGSVHRFTYDLSDDCWYVNDFFSTTSLSLTGLLLHEATELTTPATDDELAIYDLSTTTNKRITVANFMGGTALAASESQAGFVEMATSAEIYAATSGAKAVMAQDLETASAAVTLTDAATVAVNWDAGINFELSISADRALGNPTNGQPGTWRTIYVSGSDGTDRTLTFGNQFLGEVPTLTDIDSGRHYLLMIYCQSATHFIASAKRALGTA